MKKSIKNYDETIIKNWEGMTSDQIEEIVGYKGCRVRQRARELNLPMKPGGVMIACAKGNLSNRARRFCILIGGRKRG